MGRFLGGVLIILAAAVPAWAQDATAVERQVEGLRTQLREVTEQEARLRERARRLDEDMEPASIERSLAGTGTTDARALRDERRRQLERQKANVETQLASLSASRSRLEAAVATAEAEAVRLRAAALGAANAPPRAEPAAAPPAAAKKVPAAVKERPAAPRKSRPLKRSRPRRRA